MRWALIVAWCMMTGCGKQIPAEIIQPAQMEEVLRILPNRCFYSHQSINLLTLLKPTLL